MEQRPSATAWRVALRRAAHQMLDQPKVFDDPLALRIVGRKAVDELRTAKAKAARSRYARALRAFIAARSRHTDEMLAIALKGGVGQYLILGAGLDTSAFKARPDSAGLRIFEVDHPATQGWKRDILSRTGIPVPESLAFVPVDFEKDKLPDALRAAGFDAARAALVSWLGVVPYLHRESILETLTFVGSLPRCSAIVFDYGVPPASLGFFQRLVYARLARRVARAGEPFRTFFEPADLRALLRGAGFTTVDDLDGPAINARYFAGRSDGLRVGGAGHIVQAVV